jgi:hypothetical protein
MTGLLLVATLLAAPLESDTTVAIRQGDDVMVQGISGEIRVEAWRRGQLEVTGDDGDEVDVVVRRSGSRVVIRPDDSRGRRSSEVTLRLPPWVPLQIEGRRLDVTIEGMQAGVSVQNLEGDISVTGVSGPLSLSTVEGEVHVQRARGSVSVNAQADDVVLRDVEGDVWVSSGSGSIDLIDMDGATAYAETVSGDVTFVGRIRAGGTYAFSVHDGDADLTLPSDVSARVSVSTFDGEFDSDFPVTLERFSGGRTFDFTLGEGAASLSIQVFDGEIRLRERRGGR